MREMMLRCYICSQFYKVKTERYDSMDNPPEPNCICPGTHTLTLNGDYYIDWPYETMDICPKCMHKVRRAIDNLKLEEE